MADHCREKLIRRHPHVFGEREAATAGEVLRNWQEIKREQEQGGEIFGHLPETLPVHDLREEGAERAASVRRPRVDGPRATTPASGSWPLCARRWRPAWIRS